MSKHYSSVLEMVRDLSDKEFADEFDELMEHKEEEAIILRLQGFIAALKLYGWCKDGVAYVGTCGTTLGEAIDYAIESAFSTYKERK